jgi:DNA repair exonuclease SbcCD ATPase subunit
VHFKHDDQTLHFKVVVDQESGNQRKVKDTKSLSGGERSYTTLALLLAVGASVQSPFRCMDGFDIFMDEKQRRVTLETLHNEAQTVENINKQYIFITPNDLSSVTPVDGEVEIKQMKPPARGVAGDSD